MKVSLEAQGKAGTPITLTAPPAELNLVPPAGYEVVFDRPVSLELEVRRVGEEFFLGGAAAVDVQYTCVRCLRAFRAPVRTAVDVIVHRVPAPAGSSGELDQYVEVPLGTQEFDLAPYVREALVLALLPTPHCREDCRGLCAHCGADLNLESCRCDAPAPDPRWEGLKPFVSTER